MKLNPCPNPFCNNLKPDITKSKLKHNHEKPWFIWCGECENELGGYESKQAAINGWNNCPNEAAARAEALEDAVKAMREAIRKTWAFERASPDTPLHIRFLDGFSAAIIVVKALAKREGDG